MRTGYPVIVVIVMKAHVATVFRTKKEVDAGIALCSCMMTGRNNKMK